MLRAENCIAGTSTTGTGTLTLARCPAPPGGTDFFQAFSSQGFTGALNVSYCIIEYTTASFLTAKQQEKGVGTLTLGANIGATTLARATVQQTAINMDTATPTYDTGGPSAITISNAGNTLVFIGASGIDLPPCSPFFNSGTMTSDSDTIGALPVNGGAATAGFVLANNADHYSLFEWRVPMLVKRMAISVEVNSSGTPNRTYGRLYEVSSTCKPTKLLYDFGAFFTTGVGSATNALSIGRVVQTTATGSGIYLTPGEYFIDIMVAYTGGTTPQLSQFAAGSAVISGRLGATTAQGSVICGAKATGGSTGAAPATANISSLSAITTGALYFTLSTT